MSQMSTALQPGEINLDLIPINWPLTPVGGKKDAYLTGWQNKPQDIEAIKTVEGLGLHAEVANVSEFLKSGGACQCLVIALN